MTSKKKSAFQDLPEFSTYQTCWECACTPASYTTGRNYESTHLLALIAEDRSSALKRHLRFVTARFANLDEISRLGSSRCPLERHFVNRNYSISIRRHLIFCDYYTSFRPQFGAREQMTSLPPLVTPLFQRQWSFPTVKQMELKLAVSFTVCCPVLCQHWQIHVHSYSRLSLQIQNRQSFEPGVNWIRNIFWLWCDIFISCALFADHTSCQLMYALHYDRDGTGR